MYRNARKTFTQTGALYTTREALAYIRLMTRDISIATYEKVVITVCFGANDARDPALCDEVRTHACIHTCQHMLACLIRKCEQACIHTYMYMRVDFRMNMSHTRTYMHATLDPYGFITSRRHMDIYLPLPQ